ncbi:hypothetical protein PCYB_004780, partial [Plasmodium cynomolgi strain B]
MVKMVFLNIINIGAYDDKLPSNTFKKKLLENCEFDKMKLAFQLEKPEEGECTGYITNILVQLYINYRAIARSYCINDGNTKCCRDINYYLDLIIGIIRSSGFGKQHKNDLIQRVNDFWKETFVKFTGYDCKREEGSYTEEKRSILKQLYDICDDKSMPRFNKDWYNDHLKNKWNEIINSNSSNLENLYFHINGEPLNKKVKYRDFLLNFEDINCNGYNNINLNDILVKSVTIEQKSPMNISSSHGDSAEIGNNSTYPQEPVSKTENRTSNILDLRKNLPITFITIAGIGS